MVLLPLAGLGVYALLPAEEAPEPEQDALGTLAAEERGAAEPAATQPAATAVAPAAPPPAQPVAHELPEPAEEAPEALGEEDFPEGEEVADEDEGAAAEVPDEPESPEKKAKSVTDAQDGFWIQAASLRLKEKADRLAEKLRDKGYDAQSMAYGDRRAGWWHVVRIGPYFTRMEAEKARVAFARTERMNTAVLPRAHGPYYIQIASLRSKARADKEVRRLHRLGHNAVVGTINTKARGTWYTLRVGPFDFETDAYGYQKLLESDGVRGDITPRPKNPPPVEDVPVDDQPAEADEPVDSEPTERMDQPPPEEAEASELEQPEESF